MLDARRGAGTLPGMAPAAEPTPEPSATTIPERRRRKRPASGRASSGAKTTIASVPFGGEQKITVSTRTYRPLWDAYSDLAVELTGEGRGRVFQNDVINAVLAVCLPADAKAARARLAEYRGLLEADPPRDLRTVS